MEVSVEFVDEHYTTRSNRNFRLELPQEVKLLEVPLLDPRRQSDWTKGQWI
jgi:hypothetical protein